MYPNTDSSYYPSKTKGLGYSVWRRRWRNRRKKWMKRTEEVEWKIKWWRGGGSNEEEKEEEEETFY